MQKVATPLHCLLRIKLAAIVLLAFSVGIKSKGQDLSPPRCRVVPGAHQDYAVVIDGKTRAVWNFTEAAPRPFLYPLIGPSGESLTRMGHPGAPDHDHHRSVWFAHHKLEGQDFWSEHGGTEVRQARWYALEDGEETARIAVQLTWIGVDEKPLMNQDVVLEFRPLENDELVVEIQSLCAPASGREKVTLEQTNFGLLAVRVSKSVSQVFGVGILTSDAGETGEPALFGKPHRWIDYSGANPKSGDWFEEGITYFDHPSNPGFPNAWHVRADGWMCASPCFNHSLTCTTEDPLTLRYLLHLHRGRYNPETASKMFSMFADSLPFSIQKSQRGHTRYEIARIEAAR